MVWIILSIVLFIVLFMFFGLKKKNVTVEKYGEKVSVPAIIWKINAMQLLSLFAFVLVIPACIAKVPANSVGILYSPFTGTSEITLSEGYHSKNPLDTVYNISSEVQTMSVSNLTTQTKDAQFVNSTLDIKYRVDQDKAFLVFKQFKTLDNMSQNLIIPTTQRVLELITTRYNVMDVLGESRSQIYAELEMELSEELAKYGVAFYSISISDMDAGSEIEAAITAEAVAKKAVETAEQELLKTETEAKKKAVEAQAAQDAAKIEAETKIIQAQAEKEANELLQQSLSQQILAQEWIAKWNGKTPTYYSGSANDLLLNMGNLEE